MYNTKNNITSMIEESSGNVFFDLGHPEPEQAMMKAGLVQLIRRAIKRKRLPLSKAAERLSLSEQDLHFILDGIVFTLHVETLFLYLQKLGHDVEIVVKPSSYHSKKLGNVIVSHV